MLKIYSLICQLNSSYSTNLIYRFINGFPVCISSLAFCVYASQSKWNYWSSSERTPESLNANQIHFFLFSLALTTDLVSSLFPCFCFVCTWNIRAKCILPDRFLIMTSARCFTGLTHHISALFELKWVVKRFRWIGFFKNTFVSCQFICELARAKTKLVHYSRGYIMPLLWRRN